MPALSLGGFDFLRLISQVGIGRAMEIIRELQLAFEAADLRVKVTHTLNAFNLCADFTTTDVDDRLVEIVQSIVASPAFDQVIDLLELLRVGETFAAGLESSRAVPQPLVVKATAGIDPAMLFQLAMLIWNLWKSWRN